MISTENAGDWLTQMKRARRHFTLVQFKIFLDELEKIVAKDFGYETVWVRNRKVDTIEPTPIIKVRDL